MRAVKNLKKVVAVHATEIALGPFTGRQFNPAVASLALGTSDIGLFHVREPTTLWGQSEHLHCRAFCLLSLCHEEYLA
jgi:hypothetical protein